MITQGKLGKVRVRMAPSPTGSLHVGGVRTAIYNILFAQKNNGVCVLRIEDTDEERSTKEFEQDILDSFSWLGLTFDEGIMPDGSSKGDYGPYRQTERLDLYEKFLHQLLSESKAFYCFCTKEELEGERQSQEIAGLAPKYNGKCRSVSGEESARRLSAGRPAVIRLKVGSGKKHFSDLVRGEVEFETGLMGDIVIAKSLRQPLYNFAVVIDDATMEISHVFRGEEHLANTPKQLLIAEALGVHTPIFAHLPIILSATGKGKMSKRDGGTTVGEYKAAGYLPSALVNFLVLVGWHPAPGQSSVSGENRPIGGREILTFPEMAELFSIDRVQKGGAVFDKNKLDFFNSQYIRSLPDEELSLLLADDRFSEEGWRTDLTLFKKAVAVYKERLVTLGDFRAIARLLFELPEYDAGLLVWKKSTPELAKENLIHSRELLVGLPDQLFRQDSLEPKVMAIADQYGRGDLLWPLRVALSGQTTSPPPVDLLVVLGKTESLARVDAAINKLNSS